MERDEQSKLYQQHGADQNNSGSVFNNRTMLQHVFVYGSDEVLI